MTEEDDSGYEEHTSMRRCAGRKQLVFWTPSSRPPDTTAHLALQPDFGVFLTALRLVLQGSYLQ